jgi:putative transposase
MNTNQLLIKPTRNSRMQIGEFYFWTSTVKDWKRLFMQDKYKNLILNCLKELVAKKLIKIYAFVIMPNHIHLVWEMLDKNGKEMPHASFNKKTAHEIIKDLKQNHVNALALFKVDEKEREYRIWQRDPLAVEMDCKNKVEQKIDYIHRNPLHERWNLATAPELYKWSSAAFYDTGIDTFGLLTHYMERF